MAGKLETVGYERVIFNGEEQGIACCRPQAAGPSLRNGKLARYA
jgi:hypothetical protein